MQARCPHCTQVFTTERAGFQFCPRCGQQVDVPGVVDGRPAGEAAGWQGTAGPSERAGRVAPPWERRGELGLVRAFALQWKETMLRPQAFWSTVPPGGHWKEALLFGWVVFAVEALLSLPVQLLNLRLLRSLRPMLESAPEAQARLDALLSQSGGGLGAALGGLLLRLALFPVGVLVVAAAVHGCALLLGAARNGFTATFRAVPYALAPALLGFVPCLGLLAWVYCVVQLVLGLQSLQETSGERAAGAVLAPVGLLACCWCFGLAGAGMMATGAALR